MYCFCSAVACSDVLDEADFTDENAFLPQQNQFQAKVSDKVLPICGVGSSSLLIFKEICLRVLDMFSTYSRPVYTTRHFARLPFPS